MSDRILQVGDYSIRPRHKMHKRIGTGWFLRNKPVMSSAEFFVIKGARVRIGRVIWSHKVSDKFYKVIQDYYDKENSGRWVC